MNSDEREAGLSLIELIIVVVLLGIMGTIVGSILVNSWTVQNDVMTTTQATNRGQLMGQSIEKAARNADAIRITGDGRYVGFRVRGSAGYTCAAFAVQADTPFDTIVSSSAALLPLPTASVGWSQPWLSKNVKTNGSLYFTVSSSGAPVVSYNFQVKTNAAPVTIRGAASTRGQGVIVSTDSSPQGASPCWN